MSLERTDNIAAVAGYDHMHILDRPYCGIGGLSSGQQLAHWFWLEAVMRKLYFTMSTKPDYLTVEFRKLEELPTDR
jgi:hypothetical protein